MDVASWTVENDPTRTPIDRLCQSLSNRGLLTDKLETFDDINHPVPELYGRQFDRRGVRTDEVPPLDDLGASLGAFDLLLVAAGRVRPLPDGAYEITITKAGVFAEDDYDFEKLFQPLGFWDITDHYVANEIDVDRKLSHPLTTCTMSNDTFRNWRHATGFGADYKVFSDLKVTNYDPPLVFYCDPTVGPL
jgi:hypothetical protein